MAELIKGNCPGCGKPLEIPGDLEEFSCMYCGARLPISALTAVTPGDREEYSRLREELRPDLPKTVSRYPDHFKKITKKDFFPTFEAYENENREILRRLDACAAAHPEGVAAASKELAADMLDGLEAYLQGERRWQRKTGRDNLLFETRAVLAIFLTPLVKKMNLLCAEDFRTELHRQWLERFPKQEWSPGDYEVLAAGFKRRKWCFITTAVCAHEGKSDDCAELTAFRAFRDGWLTEHGGGELIAEYYDKAPGIVACIELCDDPGRRYEEIRSRWLSPCYRALQEGRYEDCRDSYVAMVRTLEQRYYH